MQSKMKKFVQARMAAHAAGTAGLDNDALVQAALQIDRANAEVRANMAARKRGERVEPAQPYDVFVTYRRQGG